MSGSPCQGPGTGFTPPLSTSVPGTPPPDCPRRPPPTGCDRQEPSRARHTAAVGSRGAFHVVEIRPTSRLGPSRSRRGDRQSRLPCSVRFVRRACQLLPHGPIELPAPPAAPTTAPSRRCHRRRGDSDRLARAHRPRHGRARACRRACAGHDRPRARNAPLAPPREPQPRRRPLRERGTRSPRHAPSRGLATSPFTPVSRARRYRQRRNRTQRNRLRDRNEVRREARSVVFPAQPGGTRREVLGSDGLPGSER